MENKSRRYLLTAAALFAAFILFTVLVALVDVEPIGPEGSSVGFAAINRLFFELTGFSAGWHTLSNLLGVIAILIAAGFAVLGVLQFIRRKSLLSVDRRILLLGALYLLTMVFYLFFELVKVNYRPVILDSELEASYPSSHTMLTVVISVSAIPMLHRLLPDKPRLLTASFASLGLLLALTVLGRMLSGVHWFTDIIGGLLLASALVALWYSAVLMYEEKHPEAAPPALQLFAPRRENIVQKYRNL